MIQLVLKMGVFCIGLVVIGTVCTNIWTYITTESHIYTNIADVPHTEIALVPGAATWLDGNISSIFRDRIDKAIALYDAGKVTKILVSGDNGTNSYNEVDPAREYLLSHGVPIEAIYLDYAGFDTYSTMYRAGEIFEISSAVIVTQKFHLPRAVFLARTRGINALGVQADSGTVLFRNWVREVFATNKAVIDILVDRVPKYLGEKNSIDTVQQNSI